MITVTFADGCLLATASKSLWQYDYGQQLEIVGLDLPEVFQVDFCNSGDTSTITVLGENNVVSIPDQFILDGRGITAFCFVYDETTGGTTRAEMKLPVLPRPERTEEQPDPEQEHVIDQLISELGENVEDAEAWAIGERDGVPVSEGDPTYNNNAKYWAGKAMTDAPVTSVNGKTGDIVLDLDDIPNGETYARATPEQLAQIGKNADDIADIDAMIPSITSESNHLVNVSFLTNRLTSYRTSAAQDTIDAGKQEKITAYGILKRDRSGNITAAIAGADYVTADALNSYRKATAQDAIDNAQAADIAAINDKIPSTASKNNKLVAWSTFNGQLGTKQAKITANGILKGDGAGGVSAAVAGTDYLAPSALDAYRTAAAQDEIDAAQDADIDDLKSAFNTGEMEYPVLWEQGNLDITTGQPVAGNNAVRSSDYIGPGSYIIRPNGLRFYVYKFLTDGTRDGSFYWGVTSTTTLFVPSTNKARIVVARTDWKNIAPAECTVTLSQATILSGLIYKENVLDFLSICHQGYSETGTVGHDLLTGYELAAKYGFNYAETDVKLTSDNVVVCCHDASFIDQTTGDTIVVAEHTAAELKTYNYFGGAIATLDEVMATCKMNRIGLAIDQITPAILPYVFPVVKKYGMQRSVVYLGGWAAGNTGYATNVFNAIVAFDKKANIMFLCNTASVRSEMVTWINALNKGEARVYLSCNSSAFSASDIAAITGNLNADVTVALYTIDDATTAKSYYPYITALTSNKISLSNILS